MKKPVIAIPIGDPAGVGPEIVAKSIASDEPVLQAFRGISHFVWYCKAVSDLS